MGDGAQTSDAAVATIAAYAAALGKTAIVTRECPGFLVNRILSAYLLGFLRAVYDGADFLQVDRVMEAYGWPIGPAYLQDVVGLDARCRSSRPSARDFRIACGWIFRTRYTC
jgi:3-hydroxyacyl-CoA dehydrogenase/enoyl-CoA hydratase/3-hydroxybutyryl-CoA epimerase/enoyl-CoA isomerase